MPHIQGLIFSIIPANFCKSLSYCIYSDTEYWEFHTLYPL